MYYMILYMQLKYMYFHNKMLMTKVNYIGGVYGYIVLLCHSFFTHPTHILT